MNKRIWDLYAPIYERAMRADRKLYAFMYERIPERIRDKEHRYYDCPRCRQQVRVPRGKGKISITCPKCKEKFVKKT